MMGVTELTCSELVHSIMIQCRSHPASQYDDSTHDRLVFSLADSICIFMLQGIGEWLTCISKGRGSP